MLSKAMLKLKSFLISGFRGELYKKDHFQLGDIETTVLKFHIFTLGKQIRLLKYKFCNVWV